MNTTTEQTPAQKTAAQKTAAILTAVAAHLTAHPHLPAVNVGRDGDVHIASYGSDWTDETGLIAWAETLPDATITADRYPETVDTDTDTVVRLRTTIHGQKIEVWDAIATCDALALEPDSKRTLTLAELRVIAEQVNP